MTDGDITCRDDAIERGADKRVVFHSFGSMQVGFGRLTRCSSRFIGASLVHQGLVFEQDGFCRLQFSRGLAAARLGGTELALGFIDQLLRNGRAASQLGDSSVFAFPAVEFSHGLLLLRSGRFDVRLPGRHDRFGNLDLRLGLFEARVRPRGGSFLREFIVRLWHRSLASTWPGEIRCPSLSSRGPVTRSPISTFSFST